ncbi:hypothetical protein [Streptomyces sp. NPDC017673]|uniref:hypothetical protein n=1 Tax=Streptomyces sp. NPDC017673 TaxID=3365005 RepID=UPI0037B99A6F
MIFGHPLVSEPPQASGRESMIDPGFLRRNLTAAEHYWQTSTRRDLQRGEAGDHSGAGTTPPLPP